MGAGSWTDPGNRFPPPLPFPMPIGSFLDGNEVKTLMEPRIPLTIFCLQCFRKIYEIEPRRIRDSNHMIVNHLDRVFFSVYEANSN